MAEISIWRWAITEDLDALFASLVAAPAEEYAKIAAEIAGPQAPSLDEMARATEARMRSLGLPDEILETMLKGLRTTLEEEQALAQSDAEEAAPGITLASSHSFYDDPYASLPDEEVARQVEALAALYRAAASKSLGRPGQSGTDFLGLDAARLEDDAVWDVLLESGLEGAEWVWATPEKIWVLSRWQGDRELPIDLEFVPLALEKVAAAKRRL